MLIKNEKIVKLLKDKKEKVSRGQELNRIIEDKANDFIEEFFKQRGVEKTGEKIIPETEDTKEIKSKVYSGTYQELSDLFSLETKEMMNEQIGKLCEKEISELTTLQNLVQKINEKVSDIIDSEKIELKEFEEISTIKLTDTDEVEINIVDKLEEFKEKYLARNK